MEPDGQTYVYGIARAGAISSLPAEGVEGRPVQQVTHASLAAIVGEAPAGPVKANRRNLMAHTAVLQEIAASQCVLPMQFGIVMPGEQAVVDELLVAHEEALDAQLDAFEKLVELDVKVVCPQDQLLRTIVAERPELSELSEQLKSKPPDATYFDRIRLGEMVAGAVEETRQALSRSVIGRLEPLAVSTRISDPAHEHMLVNVAFLVDRARVGKFDGEVEAIAGRLGPDMRCKYVGPLPPFHFVETAADTGSPAWA